MLPTEREDESEECLNCVAQNCFRLRDEDDLLFEKDGLEDADDGGEGQKFEDAVDRPFLGRA